MPEQNAPNFFAVVNDMAKRFVELMQSDYRMKRKVGRNYTNAVASGMLDKKEAVKWGNYIVVEEEIIESNP
jgi:hypothetical protein